MTQILVVCVRVTQLLLFHLLPLLAYYSLRWYSIFDFFLSFFSLLFSYSLLNIVVMCQQLCERVFQWNLFRNCNRILCTQNIANIIFITIHTNVISLFHEAKTANENIEKFFFLNHTPLFKLKFYGNSIKKNRERSWHIKLSVVIVWCVLCSM